MAEWTATVTTGVGKAAGEFRERGTLQHWQQVGYVPFPGTLNLDCPKSTRAAIRRLPTSVRWEGPDRLVDHAKVFYPVDVNGVACHVRVLATHLEAIAPARLRKQLNLADGQTVTIATRPPVRISVAVMAHPKREKWVPGLVDSIDAHVTVVWDRHNDRWDTGRRALLAFDPSATHHLVVQDDAIVCRDLIASLTRAAEVSAFRPVGLYIGNIPARFQQIRRCITKAYEAGRPWMEMEGPWWGPGILLPTADIEAVVAYGDSKPSIQNCDMKISRYYLTRRIGCWYTVPSLVDHRTGDENPSLVPGRTASNRKSLDFIGRDVSALTIPWHVVPDAPVTFAQDRTSSRHHRTWKAEDMDTYRHRSTGKTLQVPAGSLAAQRLDAKPRHWEKLDAEPTPPPTTVTADTAVPDGGGNVEFDSPEPPPRSGRGSGRDAWAAWAAQATHAPESVYAALSRDEIIALLEDEGVLDREAA